MVWNPFPFVRIVCFLIAGILLGIYQPDLLSWKQAEVFGLILLGIFLLLAIGFPDSSTSVKGTIALTTVFVLGYFRTIRSNESHRTDNVIHCQDNIDFYTVHLVTKPTLHGRVSKAEGVIESILTKGIWQKAEGRIQLLFISDKLNQPGSFQYGDVLMIKGNPQRIPAPSNPGEFDYKQYLSYKNVFHQQIVKPSMVKFLKHDPASLIFEYSYAAHDWGERVLKKYVSGKNECAIVTALLLGSTEGLDDEIITAYASTGVIHVLSVSGLHVGIVYMILLFFFRPMNNHVVGKWIIAVASVIILWSYAFITGLSPSVLRSVTMFTLIAISRPLNVRSDIYNTLSLSALVLLLYDPFMIMSVGFQLSYLALVGIIYFQPRFYYLWEPRSFWIEKIWEVSSVSLAAQLVTFPLTILYFHQFPIYFLITNLIVIPAALVVLIGGMALLALQFITPLAHIIGLCLKYITMMMNSFTVSMNEIPGSTIHNVMITATQYWIMMGILLCIVWMFNTRKFIYVIAISTLTVAFSYIQWIRYFSNFSQQKITVYNLPHHSAIDLFDKGNVYSMLDSALSNDTKKIMYSISPNRIMNGIQYTYNGYSLHPKSIPGLNVFYWKKKYFLQITNAAFKVPLNLPVFDYCIISNNAVHDLVMIRQTLNFKKLIIDSSNSYYLASDLVKQARENRLDVYSVLHQGAFEEAM